MEKLPEITPDRVVPLLKTPYVSLFDLQYAEGRHYYDASRRSESELVAVKSDAEFTAMVPDAVSCFVIVIPPDESPRLLLLSEYRYPVGRCLLGVPAGLIDPADRQASQPLLSAAVREIREETGLTVTPEDRLEVINPLVFSTPGLSDESNALILAVIRVPDLGILTQQGEEETECIHGFRTLTREEALQLLRRGSDVDGFWYPLYTFAALTYFVSGLWEE